MKAEFDPARLQLLGYLTNQIDQQQPIRQVSRGDGIDFNQNQSSTLQRRFESGSESPRWAQSGRARPQAVI